MRIKTEEIPCGMYIAGEWGPYRTELPSYSPSTQEVLQSVPIATTEELDKAVDAANNALKIWGNNTRWSWVKRAEVIDEWVQLIKARVDSTHIQFTSATWG